MIRNVRRMTHMPPLCLGRISHGVLEPAFAGGSGTLLVSARSRRFDCAAALSVRLCRAGVSWCVYMCVYECMCMCHGPCVKIVGWDKHFPLVYHHQCSPLNLSLLHSQENLIMNWPFRGDIGCFPRVQGLRDSGYASLH